MSEWSLIRLGALAEVKGGKRLPKGELLTSIPSAHPYVRITDMQDKWLNINENTIYVNPNIQHAIRNYTVDRGDVILSIVGHTIGLVARIGETLHKANLTENCVKILPDTTKLDKDFIYYFLVSNIGQSEIDSKIVGSSQPKLPLYNIKDIELPFPILPEQKAIASVLSSLDDKIDLLHRQNKTLEAMAETLFRQWFIEEAKEDWGEIAFGELIELHDSKRIPLSQLQRDEKRVGSLYPYYGASGVIDFINDYIFEGDYLLLSEDGENLRTRKTSIAFEANGKFWVNNHAHVLKAKRPFTNGFLRILLEGENLDSIITGAVQPKINQANLVGYKVPNFPHALVEQYVTVADPWFKKVASNKGQIQTLEKLRDTLLPKLMSGEVRVRYEEETVLNRTGFVGDFFI